jgi:hypothetical protein
LRPGSPAIDAGNPGFVPPPDHDQRGIPFQRVVDGRVDIGAFESQTEPIDFDSNGVVDCVDVDALVHEIVAGSNSIAFDLTGDALLDRNDLNVWLTLAGLTNLPSANPYLAGDANLDGFVDAEDFVIWNQHKFTLTAAWCSGDFNADGFTDAQDFIIWNGNKFQSSDGVSHISFPKSADSPHSIEDPKPIPPSDRPLGGTSSLSPPLVPLTVKLIDSVFATSQCREDEDRPTTESIQSLGDSIPIYPWRSR